jgi:ABC-2 type transport system ATP-binding protein
MNGTRRWSVTDVVEVQDLVRTYKAPSGLLRRSRPTVTAVRGISFTIGEGELFGLLGPNGAGKTTTVKILSTLLLPTSGSVRVLGFDVERDTNEVRRRIGHVFGGERGLYDRLSGLDNLRYFADLYRVTPGQKARRISELLEVVGLVGQERIRVENYSRGMRQRLHIARGLLHDPRVLFLDEPTIGLDPVAARELRTLIASLAGGGKTVLLTTHYMFEADTLCGRIAVINGGRIVAEGTPEALKARTPTRTIVEIETFGADETAISRLRSVPGVASVTVEERGQAQLLLVHTERGRELVQSLLGALDGFAVGRVAAREPTLEDTYVYLVSDP